jgi:hypothetical protein
MVTIALVTCAQVPELDTDTRRLLAPLTARGVRAWPAVWDDPGVEWSAIDLAVVRSCWDYHERRSEFLAWARRIPRLANPADVLAWNTDKRYLCDLSDQGIPVVPTTWLEPGGQWRPAPGGRWVVKPAVSIAAMDTGSYDLADPAHRRLAGAHVRRLHAAGRTVMVQPYAHAVDTEGETSLVYFGGTFSHAVCKAAVLDGPDTGADRRFQPDGGLRLEAVQPTAAQRSLADRVMAAVPGGAARLAYARVDLVPDADGAPQLIELELTEPQLYLRHIPQAAERFARTLAALAATGRRSRAGAAGAQRV